MGEPAIETPLYANVREVVSNPTRMSCVLTMVTVRVKILVIGTSEYSPSVVAVTLNCFVTGKVVMSGGVVKFSCVVIGNDPATGFKVAVPSALEAVVPNVRESFAPLVSVAVTGMMV